MRTTQYRRYLGEKTVSKEILPFEGGTKVTTLEVHGGIDVWLRPDNGKFYFKRPGSDNWESRLSLSAIKKMFEKEQRDKVAQVPVKAFSVGYHRTEVELVTICGMNKKQEFLDEKGESLYRQCYFQYDEQLIADFKKLELEKQAFEKTWEKKKNALVKRCKQIRNIIDLMKIQDEIKKEKSK